MKRHLVEKEEISAICKEAGIAPSQFYAWQGILFEGASKAFTKEPHRETAKLQVKQEQLEAKLRKKDAVIAQLMEEHIELKKSVGED